jgi:phage I-like protein
MAGDTLGPARQQIGERLAEFTSRAERLSPLDIHARMDAIRQIAAANGLDALEALMHRSAQLALLPGHRVATQCCLEHFDAAMASESRADGTSILAALALRLH